MVAHALEDLKRPQELAVQLLIGPCRFDVPGRQQDFLAYRKVFVYAVAIVVFGLKLLRVGDCFRGSRVCESHAGRMLGRCFPEGRWFAPFHQQFLVCLVPSCDRLSGVRDAIRNRRFSAVGQLYRRNPCDGVDLAIIREGRLIQPFRPVVLFEVYVDTQVRLQLLVLALRLPVCLRVERRAKA